MANVGEFYGEFDYRRRIKSASTGLTATDTSVKTSSVRNAPLLHGKKLPPSASLASACALCAFGNKGVKSGDGLWGLSSTYLARLPVILRSCRSSSSLLIS